MDIVGGDDACHIVGNRVRRRMVKTSHSSMDCFRQCPKKYYLSREIGVKAIKSPRAPSFGSAMHEALNAYHGGCGLDATLVEWTIAVGKWNLDHEDYVLGELIIIAYSVRWPRFVGERKVESAFEHEVIGPDGEPDPDIVMRGYIDIELPTKVVDHKTTSANLSASKLYELARSPQALEYILASPEDVTEALWDVIRVKRVAKGVKTPEGEQEFYKRDCKGGKKGDPKPGTFLEDETWEEYRARIKEDISRKPDDYFARVEIKPTEDELDSRRYDIWATSKLMQRAIEDGAFPRMDRSCDLFGGCEYKPVCWDGVDPLNSELYQISKRGRQ